MKKVLLSGATGKMGLEIQHIISGENDLVLAKGFSKGDSLGDFTDNADLLIDFSNPDFFEQALEYCLKNNIAFISGTTGLLDKHFQQLSKASESIAVLWAPNMSVGVHLMSEMFRVFEENKNFDFQIEEIHHKHKVDAPSGTAKFLQKQIESHGIKTVDAPVALRGGGVFGVHQLFAFSEEEVLSIKHEALNRTVFAKGAVRAAIWLAKQPKGLYEFKNVLGF
ncbi:MAG: 4-hydroxy-tetrahydrodipicolinate reductase [Bdellovibrionaceae bacterium]|jgi:4-hydroxy-tetrahydrodipicolinate reductase|nr:4-hydroxy-tetrahydrodipicolinate reductase [Pseudobdellovibrionaceae bacterium]